MSFCSLFCVLLDLCIVKTKGSLSTFALYIKNLKGATYT